ncbi:MAG: hypothetical protein K0Q95_15 [Bacteroidota bacterium]|jgi:hypothetical protein|nr:hypothetical protein [Bacteroidota bacterium]
MTEEFLHYVWKFRLFDQKALLTSNNEKVIILKSGDHNFDSGPDFFNAKVLIGDTTWAGNVEVHINSSDWDRHHHQSDKAYDNIILHVVNTADKKLFRESGEEIPTIEIGDKIDRKVYENYLKFKSNSDWIPCSNQVATVSPLILQNTLDKLLLERLERKSAAILNSLSLNNNNWEETFYQLLARNFGFKINAEPFELLAKSLPLNILSRQKTSLLQMEALLFGQAGMLNEHFEDPYPACLQNEYLYLKHKHKLQNIQGHLWKFLRMRPVNFPTIRIAQFASFLFSSNNLFSSTLEVSTSDELRNMFLVQVSPYWNTHYLFDKASDVREKHLGENSADNIIINTVVPFLFTYGKQKGIESFVERALFFMETLKGENNIIIKKWKEHKLPVSSAYSTQALLQLKNEYCSAKKCLTCSIGNYLLKNS